MRERGFTLLELLAVVAILAALSAVAIAASSKIYAASSLAVSSNNIRQLAAGGIAYLADHGNFYWPWREGKPEGDIWWCGFETRESRSRPEGERDFDPGAGPLGGYIPKGFRPDPSFALSGRAFKPKFRSGYIGVGYNTLLGGGWNWVDDAWTPRLNHWQLSDPEGRCLFYLGAGEHVSAARFFAQSDARRVLRDRCAGTDRSLPTQWPGDGFLCERERWFS